ncbi:hypothetical protein C8J57DRAFT_1166822 [Mycena rebaudengoi]|nr:hypothetical protein C8J57DRAFT_1166822 [Mycena rebaudengoi]
MSDLILDSHGRSTLSDIRGRMPDLDAHIPALEKDLAAAKLEPQELQTRIDAYKYPILTLPIEITSEIFVHFLPPYPERPPATGPLSPHMLGQICRTWREIALSTPRLWRAIELCPPREAESRTMALELLKIWLSHSKNCPLSICLLYPHDELPNYPELEIDVVPFVKALIPHSQRWEYIDFTLPTEAFVLLGSDFPLLRSLSLGPNDHTDPDDLSRFSSAPNLKQVILSDPWGPSEMQLPWSQLTSILIYMLEAAECAEIMQHTSALVQFRCDGVEDGGTKLVPVAPLRCLQSLELEDIRHPDGSSGQRVLMDALTTPALQHLTISNSLSDANALILRSHCSLDVFEDH